MVTQMNRHHALGRDALLRALSVFQGVTTAPGNVGGTTLFCDALIGCNDFLTNKTILLESGLAIFEDAGATAFDDTNGEITVAPAFSSQVLAVTAFYVLNNVSPSMVALLISLLNSNQGLCYGGEVTAVPVAGQFTIPTLAGLGAGRFAEVGGIGQYYAFVTREHAGGSAAPQGEAQVLQNYATLTGNFTAAAFTVDIDVGDVVLIIHASLIRPYLNQYGLPPHVGALAANWNSGVATSGNAGADLVTIGVADTKYKVHSLLVNISAFIVGSNVRVRMFMEITGTEREVYNQPFVVGTDPNGLWIINGTVGIHDVLRVEVYSDGLDDMRNCDYDYMLELM